MSAADSMPTPATSSSEYTLRTAANRAAAVREITPWAVRILRLPHVEALTGVKKTFIYNAMKEGTFPLPVALGNRSKGWIEGEVLRWIADRAAAPRLIGDAIARQVEDTGRNHG